MQLRLIEHTSSMNEPVNTHDQHRNAFLKFALAQFASCDWHWFQYHFLNLHPFARSMLSSIMACDKQIENFGRNFLSSVVAISGKKMNQDHYDQLMQRMAELLVIRQLLHLDLHSANYEIEPTAGASRKRPDLVISSETLQMAIEIKAPAVTKLKSLRQQEGVQVLSRLPDSFGKPQDKLPWPVALPRDNAVKDFLISANDKFKSFKETKNCFTLLVIVWDDFIHEVITALNHPQSGLLTSNSFAKDGTGAALTYPHVDGVVIVRHLTYFMRAAGDQDIEDRKHAFDFGGAHALPNVFVPNPSAAALIPEDVLGLLRAIPLGDERITNAAEYRPKEFIFWI